MGKWRLLDIGKQNAAYNMALDEALLEAKEKYNTPNTIRFLQFSPSAALLGYHQSLNQEIRFEFCKNNGIDINRRITGGGALFFDETQIGWEIIFNKSVFGFDIPNLKLFEKLSFPLILSLKSLGIDAEFRPRNDIEVRGRKISGTGGADYGDAFLFQGTLLVDFDVEVMFRALRVPIEKLKFKELESAKERVTCIKWETKKLPLASEIKNLIKKNFEEQFNITLEEGTLLQEEDDLLKTKLIKFQSESWIDKIKLPSSEKNVIYSFHKTKGGVIRVTLELDSKRKRIQSVLFTGDFFTYPKKAIYDLEAYLKNTPADPKIVRKKIKDFFNLNNFQIDEIYSDDFSIVLNRALEKLSISEGNITLNEANHIFTVCESYSEIKSLRPIHLLLPYCAKSLECGYRYKRDCAECGLCSIGDAYKLEKKRNMEVTTILSFEDLIEILKDLKQNGANSFIGSCCEAFYTKHIEDFEEVGLPGILIDIDSTTCYDLGKANDAYKGSFESKTELNFNLLMKVLDDVL